MARAYFRLFFDQYHPLVSNLSDEEAGRAFKALLEYTKYGVLPDLPGREVVVWPFMQEDVDRDKAAYERRCAINSEAGRKGGRGHKSEATLYLESMEEKATESERFVEKAKKTYQSQAEETKKAKEAKKSNYAYQAKKAHRTQPDIQPCACDADYVARMKRLLQKMQSTEQKGPAGDAAGPIASVFTTAGSGRCPDPSPPRP